MRPNYAAPTSLSPEFGELSVSRTGNKIIVRLMGSGGDCFDALAERKRINRMGRRQTISQKRKWEGLFVV